MIKIKIDSQELQIPDNQTILQAAEKLGIEIPSLCYLPGRQACTTCFVCVVKIVGQENLVPACATIAKDKMIIQTNSPEVIQRRRQALELLLSEHLGDCYEPCKMVCPLGLDIAEMLRYINSGQQDQAIAVLKDAMPMAKIISILCPRPCESICRRGQIDNAIPIATIKIKLADIEEQNLQPYWPSIENIIDKKVAIVGAGPAGLTAAYFMTIAGAKCTIFDKSHKPGGILNDSKIDKDLLFYETDAILAACDDVMFSQQIGVDITLDELLNQYEMVVLATGQNFIENSNLDYNKNGIVVDGNYQSSIAGVYALGSAIKPTKSAVQVIGQAKQATLAIIEQTAGKIPNASKKFNCRIGKLNEQQIEAISTIAKTINSDTGEDILSLANNCLHCDCLKKHNCQLKKHSQQYQANPQIFQCDKPELEYIKCDSPQGSIIYEKGKCIKCGKCIAINPYLTFINRGYDSTLAPAVGMSWQEALNYNTTEIAQNCPTAALAFEQ